MTLAANILNLALLAGIVTKATAHIALWHPAMYGWVPDEPNQNDVIDPLRFENFTDWWFHGYLDKPPADGEIMDLPSGGTYTASMSCNKALAPVYGYVSSGPYSCSTDVMHTSDPTGAPVPHDVKGCGIGIAYKSDVNTIEPEDFTMISVNYTCPWWASTDFQIPGDLPPCPEGGCHCMWGWIHAPDSGTEQMYFLGYRCNITGATGTTPLPLPQIARKCPFDETNCTVGSKQPHYWLQAERNNNFQSWQDPPYYNGDYGFSNGAQTDLFDAISTTAIYTQTSWAGYENVGPVTLVPTASASDSSQVDATTTLSGSPTPASSVTSSTSAVPSSSVPTAQSSSVPTAQSSSVPMAQSTTIASETSSTEMGSPTFHVPVPNNGISTSPSATGTSSSSALSFQSEIPCAQRPLSARAVRRLQDPTVLRQHEARAERRARRKRASFVG